MQLLSKHESPNEIGAVAVAVRLGAVVISLAAFSGCQTYQPDPLDPAAHSKQWQERDAASEEVRAFAQRLQSAAAESVAFDPGNGLTLPEGEVVALVFNPDLRVARLRAGVAKATADHAGRWDDPELSIDVLRITEGVPDPWVVGSALSLTIPVSGRLQAEKARADATLHRELAKVAEEEWKVMRELRDAWLAWSADRLRLEQTEQIVAALDGIIESATKLAEGGEMLRTESNLFVVEQESRRADVSRLRGSISESEQQIRSLLGLSPNSPVRLVPALTGAEATESNRALAQKNPALLRLQAEYAVAEQTLVREIRKQFPDVVIGPQAEDDQGQSRIGFIGAIPIPILNSNKGGIAEARAEREVARAAYETEYERLVGRLAAVRARLEGVRARRKALNATLVPLVDRQVADARRLVELGEGGSLVLLESLVRAHEAKLDLIDVQLEEGKGRNEIRFLLGPDRLRAKTKAKN